MDLLLFGWINGMAGHWPLLDWVMVGLSEWPSLAAPLAVVSLWFWPGALRRERRRWAILMVMAVLMALGIAELTRSAHQRPRPFEVHKVVLLIAPPPISGFPSTHLTLSAAAIAASGERLGRWSALAWAGVVGTMVGRVYVGVHYPMDVVGGLIIGWLVGAIVYHNRDVLTLFADRVVAFGEELL